MTEWIELDGGKVRLALADCRDVLPTISDAAAVVTDPPYGIGFGYASHDDAPEKWFALIDDVLPLCRKAARFVIMPSCAVKRLPWWYERHAPDWLIAWHKGSPGHQSAIGFNDWEPHLCWGRPSRPMHDHFTTVCGFEENGHPCPKPLAYSLWLVARAAEKGEVVVDPFMGSGTTGVAAVRLERSFIGIEKDPAYFRIAVKRIEAELNRAPLFAKQPAAVQRSMFTEAS